MKTLACDFETTTRKDDCRVWAWASVDIDSEKECIGTSIDSFMEMILGFTGVVYFHNLKFDGNFIVYWLLTHGYKWFAGKDNYGRRERLLPQTFTTCISDMGAWYTVTIQSPMGDYDISNTIEIRDSLKIIPMSIEDIPETFNLEGLKKLEIDYKEDRDIEHKLTEQEKEYVLADVRILAKAIKFMLSNGQKQLTSASNAMHDFKARLGNKEFDRLFPILTPEDDTIIRKTYKGGWTYVNPKYRNLNIGDGTVYDVNSMYPWAMKYCLLPVGEPLRYFDEPKPNRNYPLYTVTFDCIFKIKPDKYPSLQLKNTMGYADNEYITESDGVTELNLTSVDFELFKENYDYEVFTWKGGYYFKGKTGVFAEYIDYWFGVKTQAKRDHNPGMEKIAKLMLNSLYGKFGARMFGKSKIPYYDEIYDIVRFKRSDEEKRKAGYIPVATFITSYCRDKIIRAANACGERFIYADTDSLHIKGIETPSIEIDNYRLGAFKEESQFCRAKFIRQKTYMEIINDNGNETINLKACGMPKHLKDTVQEEDFFEGAVFDHTVNERFAPKLTPKIVPGGVILEETTFRIKTLKNKEEFAVNPGEVIPGKKVRKPLTKRKKCAKMGERG